LRRELSRFGAQTGLADLVERWSEVVGDGIARNAWPARIARDGTLHVATADSIWAFELGHRAPEIAQRLGVAKVRFAPGPLPSEATVIETAEPVRPTAEHEKQAAEIASSISDERLRESVQKAMGLSLARTAKEPPF
jgi:hypothetical protein